MKTLVTGASGFVGSHTVRALLESGHEVRATARSENRIRQALGAPPADVVEVVEADATDAVRVRAALAGCDAVIHAAAVYSLDARRSREVGSINVSAARTVLEAAIDLGLESIVHVSSYVAMLPTDGVLTPDTALGSGGPPYASSKAESERLARKMQASGAPVTVVQPGMVWGPDDPAEGESTQLARAVIAGKIPMAPNGSVPIVDVRDVAATLAAAVQGGTPGGRYLAAARDMKMTDVMRIVAESAGVRPPERVMTRGVMLALGRTAEFAQRFLPSRLPLGYQGPWAAAHGVPFDATKTTSELGIEFRPAEQTLRDTVEWIERTGIALG